VLVDAARATVVAVVPLTWATRARLPVLMALACRVPELDLWLLTCSFLNQPVIITLPARTR